MVSPITSRRKARKKMIRHLGRELTIYEVVHHKDGNPLNNDIKNLQVLLQDSHSALHRGKKIKSRFSKHNFGEVREIRRRQRADERRRREQDREYRRAQRQEKAWIRFRKGLTYIG
jgi:hypothetical protein